MKLLLDLQIMQTPARYRGMGQYVASMLGSFMTSSEFKKFKEIEVVLTSNLPVEEELLDFLNDTFESIQITQLPLLTMETESNFILARQRNKQIIESHLGDTDASSTCFLITSLFQSEIYPVFPSNVMKAVIAYDLIPLQMHETYFPGMNSEDYVDRYSMFYDADILFSISKTTANALQVYLGIPIKKIVVINGGPAKLPKAKKPKIVVGAKFILMTTGNDIRKNNANAISAFALFLEDERYSDFELVITSYFSDKEKENLNTLSGRVIFTGSVNDAELAWLYGHCSVVMFPSTLEGLGMPLLEAMHYDKPVVASYIDVFREISEDIPYYFNPYDRTGIANTLKQALSNEIHEDATKNDILNEYSWDKTAHSVLDAVNKLSSAIKPQGPKKSIAIVCPYPSGISAVGKNVSEQYATLVELYDIDFYFEAASYPKQLRPDIMSAITKALDVSLFTKEKYSDYYAVIYHIGNGSHHSVTSMMALTLPGIVVLHDLNLQGVFGDLLKQKNIDQNRYNLEAELNARSPDQNFTSSIINNQKAVIVHSKYAKKIADDTLVNEHCLVKMANLPTITPEYPLAISSKKSQFTIGLAGILANIKGLEVIKKIAQDERFIHDQILIFGLNFAEKGSLDKLRQLPNVIIETDLSDFSFQEKLKRLSVFVNYRTHYQGEASSATLESMRYGIPVVVRSDFGWYAELPDKSVVKVKDEDEILIVLSRLKKTQGMIKEIGENARETTATVHNHEQYAQTIHSIIEDISSSSNE